MSNILVTPLPSKHIQNRTLNCISAEKLLADAKCRTNREFLNWYLSKNTNYNNKKDLNKDHRISPKYIGVPNNVTFNSYKGNVSPTTTHVNPLEERAPLPIEEILDSNGNYKKQDHLVKKFYKRKSVSPRKFKQYTYNKQY